MLPALYTIPRQPSNLPTCLIFLLRILALTAIIVASHQIRVFSSFALLCRYPLRRPDVVRSSFRLGKRTLVRNQLFARSSQYCLLPATTPRGRSRTTKLNTVGHPPWRRRRRTEEYPNTERFALAAKRANVVESSAMRLTQYAPIAQHEATRAYTGRTNLAIQSSLPMKLHWRI